MNTPVNLEVLSTEAQYEYLRFELQKLERLAAQDMNTSPQYRTYKACFGRLKQECTRLAKTHGIETLGKTPFDVLYAIAYSEWLSDSPGHWSNVMRAILVAKDQSATYC